MRRLLPLLTSRPERLLHLVFVLRVSVDVIWRRVSKPCLVGRGPRETERLEGRGAQPSKGRRFVCKVGFAQFTRRDGAGT